MIKFVLGLGIGIVVGAMGIVCVAIIVNKRDREY